MASVYLVHSYKFYNSNLKMSQYCTLNNISYKLFNNWYYRVAPKNGILFDKEARSKRLRLISVALKKKSNYSIDDIVSALVNWIASAVVKFKHLKTNPFAYTYRQILVDILNVLKKFNYS